ncbi:MAG TPA: histidine kinase [Lachnospiraceae bacterium]|nr:histidine kinase [Lachnospiraceae bacterium]
MYTDNQKTIERIQDYLKRLGTDEDFEKVRADFVKEFKEVDAADIMQAEQKLLQDGTPLEEVQRLCDVHAALFHGKTKEEQIANAEKESIEAIKQRRQNSVEAYTQIKGHPIRTFVLENQALEKLLSQCKETIANGRMDDTLFDRLREISVHYARKGDLLYPHLKVQYKISGPSAVMWTVDDEIRDALAALAKDSVRDAAWMNRLQEVLVRIEEMIYKEHNILFPNCTLNFTEEEWMQIYRDSKDYPECFGVENGIWEQAEQYFNKMHQPQKGATEDEIVMKGGHMTVEQLEAMLNTIPLELTFVDVDNINRYFNEGPKVFKRPGMAIDREVFSCHPPKIEQMVRKIIEDFRNGTKDQVPVWMNKNGRTMLVTYMAVRDRNHHYIGTVEVVQDMEFAKEHFEGRSR